MSMVEALDLDLDHSLVLWNAGGAAAEGSEPGSPVLFKSGAKGNKEELEQQQQQHRELYKIYEQLTGPFQDFTLRDIVSKTKDNSLDSPTYNIAVTRVPPSPKRSDDQKLSSEAPGSRSPLHPTNRAMPSPSYDTRSPRRSDVRSPRRSDARASPRRSDARSPRTRSDARSPRRSSEVPILVVHGSSCHICDAKALIIKTRCLVCGKLYCRSCVKEGMGIMLEGRKCRSCLGHRFNSRYVSRAGKGWWISNRVKEAELRWATKRSRTASLVISGRSF